MSTALSWVLLVIAGLFEVAWAICLKYSEGFTRPGFVAGTIAALAASMVLLGLAARALPIGTAYAVWTGIGAFGTAMLGMCLLGESAAAIRLVCLAFILTGIVGLKLTDTT